MFDWLKKCFDVVVKTLWNGTTFFSNGWTWAVAFFTAYVLTPAQTFWGWVSGLFDKVLAMYPSIKQLLVNLHVDQLGQYWANSDLAKAVSVGSNWFPFDFALQCFTGICVLWVFCALFKLIRKSVFFFIGG